MARSLAYTHRKLSREWHPSLNGDLFPRDVTAGCNKRIWWQCQVDPEHVWQTGINNRTKTNPTGCPFCSGRRVTTAYTLAVQHPDLAAEWHPTENGDLTPETVAAGSANKVWWVCSGGPDHVWQATVYYRTHRSFNCPYCTGRRVSVTNSLETLFPKVAREWDPDRNGDLTPKDVLAAAGQRYWWRCALGHVWQAAVGDRTAKGRGCPQCARGG